MSEKILSFVKNIRDGKAQDALTGLKDIINEKQNIKESTLVTDIYETKEEMSNRIELEHGEKLNHIIHLIDEDHTNKFQEAIDKLSKDRESELKSLDEDHYQKLQQVVEKIDNDYTDKMKKILEKVNINVENLLSE